MTNEEKYISCFNELKAADWHYVFRRPKYIIKDGHTWLPYGGDDSFEQATPTDEELRWIESQLFEMVEEAKAGMRQKSFLMAFYSGDREQKEAWWNA